MNHSPHQPNYDHEYQSRPSISFHPSALVKDSPSSTSPHSLSSFGHTPTSSNNQILGPTYLTRYPSQIPNINQLGTTNSTSTATILQNMFRPLSSAAAAAAAAATEYPNHSHPWPNTSSIVKADDQSNRGWDGGTSTNGNGNGNGRSERNFSTSSSSEMSNGRQIQFNSARNSLSGSIQPPQGQVAPPAGPTGKRGSKACVACRKGKNRCEWDPSTSGSDATCRRCLMNGIPCVFEKASEKSGRARNGSMSVTEVTHVEADGRVTSLERTVQTLAQSQNQIQSTLQQILAILPQSHSQAQPQGIMTQSYGTGVPPSSIFQSSVSPPSIFSGSQHGSGPSQAHGIQTSASVAGDPATASSMMFSAFAGPDPPLSPQNMASGRGRDDSSSILRKPVKGDWPELPGFAPPNHRFGTYGIIPVPSAPPSPSRSRHSSRSSSSHSAASSSAIPRETLTAPIQALHALANAADQAAAVAKDDSHTLAIEDEAEMRDVEEDEGERGRSRKRKRVTIDGKTIHLKMRKKKRPDPTPRNPFPDVVTKGLVRETEARELWDIFFSGCHYFVPLWDKVYDQYESYIERTPFSTNGLLAVAAKIRAGNGPLGQTFHYCLEEAQGIARSTLFGPIVRKEAVMAMLILSVWSQNGWLPVGHALRMGLDMNLHRALDKLANKEERTESEERDLVVSARIWLNCYMHEHLASLGTGKPVLLRDDTSVQRARDLLSHSMASETDMRLVAGVELVKLRVRILDHLTPLHGRVDNQTISFVRRMLADLDAWHREWYAIHRSRFDDESVLVKLLETELVYAQLWTVCVALRGCQWDKLPPDQRELALEAKDAASRCMEIFLRSDNFRKHLKYATHDQLVSVAFAAVFLLKIAVLFPQSIQLPHLISQVSELAHLLSSECFAERYALTLRLMLANFRRKTGAMSTVPGTPRIMSTAPSGIQSHGEFNGNGNGDGLGNMMLNNNNVTDLSSLLSLPQMPILDHNDPSNSVSVAVDGMVGMGGIPIGNGNGNAEVGGNLWDMPVLEGFDWPTEFSPSSLPVWLQDGNLTDLGLPADGSDSLFLPLELANMFLPSGAQSNALYQYSFPDFGDVGAEAW